MRLLNGSAQGKLRGTRRPPWRVSRPPGNQDSLITIHHAPHKHTQRHEPVHTPTEQDFDAPPNSSHPDNKPQIKPPPPCRRPQLTMGATSRPRTPTSRSFSASAPSGRYRPLHRFQAQALTCAAQTCCFPAKTKPRTSCCLLVEHAPSPKRRPPLAS